MQISSYFHAEPCHIFDMQYFLVQLYKVTHFLNEIMCFGQFNFIFSLIFKTKSILKPSYPCDNLKTDLHYVVLTCLY